MHFDQVNTSFTAQQKTNASDTERTVHKVFMSTVVIVLGHHIKCLSFKTLVFLTVTHVKGHNF